MKRPALYGLMAEFSDPEKLLEAVHQVGSAGYRKVDAYSPFPVEGLAAALGFHRTRVPMLVLIGGISGGLIGFFLQYYLAVIDYPLNIGGRPLNSWPSFVVITFEMTILVAALSAVLGMLALNGLPMPHHPVFNVAGFSRASKDRFFLVIEAVDPKFDLLDTRAFLESLDPLGVSHVEA